MFANSHDGEIFYGEFETIELAIENASMQGWGSFLVGECETPGQPEDWWEAADWLEHVSCQDEYSGDWAEGWDNSTKEQRAELEQKVRGLMAEWLDRYDLRPKFSYVRNSVEYLVVDGVAVKQVGES